VGGKRKPGTIIINKPDRSTFFAFSFFFFGEGEWLLARRRKGVEVAGWQGGRVKGRGAGTTMAINLHYLRSARADSEGAT